MKTKMITGLGILGLGVVLLSFSTKGEDPRMKRYEVIRSVNGEITIHDTLIDANSKFTPEDYLAHLGFAEDAHIQIIDMPSLDESMMAIPVPHEHIQSMDSVFIMHMDGMKMMDSMMIMQLGEMHTMDSVMMVKCTGMPADSMFTFTINMDENGMNAEHQQMMIEKNIMIRQIDSLEGEIAEIEKIIEIQINDSLIDPAMLMQIDSTVTMVHTIVIHDGQGGGQMGHVIYSPEGEPDFERHVEDGNRIMDMMIFGGGEDFTMLIVSDGTEHTPKSHMQVESVKAPENALTVYPNPADKEVALQLNFEGKATTNITVTDANGKVVMQLNLGEFEGTYNQTVDVSKWRKGIYFVSIDRPGLRLVEKLIVE